MSSQNGFRMKKEYHKQQDKVQTKRQLLSANMQQNLKILQLNRQDLFSYLEEEMISNPLMIVEYSIDETPIQMDGMVNGVSGDYMMDTFIDQSVESLQMYLKKQIMCYRHTKIRDIMIGLLEYLEDNGYLELPSELELCQKFHCTSIELLDAITLMQQLEPVGICARSLRECWLIQIDQDLEAPDLAYVIVESYFDELIHRNFNQIASELDVSTEVIMTIVAYYRRLTVNPGHLLMDVTEEYVYPDIYITQEGHEDFSIVYNREQMPILSFDEKYYQELTNQADTDSLKSYIKEMKSRYHFVFQGLKKREQTLLIIAKTFVELQQKFFISQGQEKSPLTLQEVADHSDFHLSTISRAIQGKYFYTDFGVFSFTDLLFTPTLSNNLSQDLVKEQIKLIIESEDKNNPLSDQAIADRLANIQQVIARRTVAKYRVALGYASAKKRKIH